VEDEIGANVFSPFIIPFHPPKNRLVLSQTCGVFKPPLLHRNAGLGFVRKPLAFLSYFLVCRLHSRNSANNFSRSFSDRLSPP